MLRLLLLAALALTLAACATPQRTGTSPAGTPVVAAPTEPVGTARDLVRAMRARYGDRWYRTLTFVQTTTFHTPQGERQETWYEAGELPGRQDLAYPMEFIGRPKDLVNDLERQGIERPAHLA